LACGRGPDDGESAIGTANTAQATANAAAQLGQQNSVQIQAVVNGQLGVCTVSNGALQCSVQGQAAAQAQGQGAVAVGTGAKANGAGTIAQGQGAIASYAGSVAIGAGAQANADPTTAIGNNAIANGNNSVALGANTTANGSNSVALGQGSIANRDNSVSVGNAATGQTRQITNVAPGTAPTDAVNLSQLRQATTGLLSQAQTYAAAGVAQASALAQTPIFGASGNSLTAGVGAYDGQSALGIQYSHLLSAGKIPSFVSFGLAVNSNNNTPLVHAGVSVGW
jgi:Hep_Hag./YadA-like C-terminal region./Haemagglutinin.